MYIHVGVWAQSRMRMNICFTSRKPLKSTRFEDDDDDKYRRHERDRVNILAHANDLWKFNRYEHGFLGAVEEFANHREIYRPGSIYSYMWLHTVVFFSINVEKTLES